MPSGMYCIRSWRKRSPARLSSEDRFERNSSSRKLPPKGQMTRAKLSADCVSLRFDWSAKAYRPSPVSAGPYSSLSCSQVSGGPSKPASSSMQEL